MAIAYQQDHRLFAQRWYLASGEFDVDSRTLTVIQVPLISTPKVQDRLKDSKPVTIDTFGAGPDAVIMIAARTGSERPAVEHFNGRIEAPKLFARLLDENEKVNPGTAKCSRSDCRVGFFCWHFNRQDF